MLAARWHGRRDVRVEDVELSLPLGPGIVEVEVRYCGICGTDVAEFAHGPLGIRRRRHVLTGQEPPVTLGHELMGIVVAIGPDVVEVAPGDRVTADAWWRCNRCAACRTGRYNQCSKGGSIGLASDGAFAARIRFPAYAATKIPEGVSDETGALLEPLAVGLHALARGAAVAGEPVVVLGYGPIGAMTAIAANAMGLDVTVSEPHPGRRRRAEERGLRVVDPAAGEARVAARALREVVGEVRLVVEASGHPAALAVAPEITARGGTVVVVSVPKAPQAVDFARLVFFERSIVASLAYAFEVDRAAAMVGSGAIDLDGVVTGRIGLEQVPAELARLADDPGDSLKVLVDVRA